MTGVSWIHLGVSDSELEVDRSSAHCTPPYSESDPMSERQAPPRLSNESYKIYQLELVVGLLIPAPKD